MTIGGTDPMPGRKKAADGDDGETVRGHHGAPSARRAVLRAVGLIGVVAVWLVVAGFGGPAIGSLSSVQSNNQETYLPAGAESVAATEAARAFDDSGSLPAFIVFTTSGAVATGPQLAAWAGYARSLAGRPVTADRDGDLGTVGDYLVGGPAAEIPFIPSEDGSAALVVVPLSEERVTTVDADGDDPLGHVIDALRAAGEAIVADGGTGGAVHIAGPAGLIADLGAAFAGIDGMLLLVALSAVLLILVLVYRAVALPFVVLFTSICALASAGGIVYLLADNGVLTLNGQSQGILFILVVGAATDYGLLLVSRYREELTRIDSTWTAIRRAWRACLGPIAASAGTVIIGLLCLLLSDLNSNKDLGPIGAIGIASSFAAALTLLPALLMAGRWLFWPRIPRVAEHVDGRHAITQRAEPGLWEKISVFVARHPRRIWVITTIVLAAACAFVPTLKASGTSQTDVFLTDVDSIAGQEALSGHFPGGSGNPVVIIAPESIATEVIGAVGAVGGIAGEPAMVTAAGTGPQSAGMPPLVVDGMVQIQATLSAAADSEDAEQTVRAVRAVAHAVPGADGGVLVGGTTAVMVDTTDTSARDLKVIIPVVLVAVLVVLILLLRSLIAALLLVAATLLSFGSALGVSALMFNHIFDFPGADPAVPLFAFVFLVALGIDYSIFLMTRAREEVALHGPRDGVMRGLAVTGGVITSAGVVLATTFAALAVIPLLFMAQIAFIVAFGVLLDTFVVRTLLVPAAAIDMGWFTWWPVRPRPTRHQLVDIDRDAGVDRGLS